MTVPPDTGRGSFVWNDSGRFVEVHPVMTGWLVVWGHYEDFGTIRVDEGNATYASLAGARRRVADAALELTRSPQAATARFRCSQSTNSTQCASGDIERK